MSDQPTPPESPSSSTPETESDAPPEKSGGPVPETTSDSAAEAQSTSVAESPAEAVETEPAVAPPGALDEPVPAPSPEQTRKSTTYSWGTGRRKSSVARVRIQPGSGRFMIRNREVDDYFFDVRHRNDVVAPLKATDTFGKYDVFVNVHGGGQTGQAGAIVLGVARALVHEDPALEDALRTGKYLTRDARKVERKKPGQPGARKRFQFSKR